MTQERFAEDGGSGSVAGWLYTTEVRNVHPNTTIALRMNNLSGSVSGLKLYAYGIDGKMKEVSGELWYITGEDGVPVEELQDGVLYELRVTVADGGDLDLSEAEKEMRCSVVLAK